jgi:saccharopine dehydrogenase (NAD+, L-lysine forming)
VVASELAKAACGEIVIGGRDVDRAKAVAAELGGRASAVRVDVLDAKSLDEFCGQCTVIVNCAGPVMVLEDRLAQAAYRRRCHYVDLAGMGLVKERMLPHAREIEDVGLSYVVSAGWTPGLTELVPVYTHARASARMDSIESLSVYFSDAGDWSDNALRDGVWSLHRAGFPTPGYFRKGEWVRAKMPEASRKVDVGEPVGVGRFSLFSMPELAEMARRLNDCDVFAYSYLAGFRNAVAATILAVLPLPEKWGVRMLRNIFRRNRQPVGGFVIARAQGRGMALTARIVFEKGRDYWINGVVAATVARMIATGAGVRAGVRYLADAVDAIPFMEALRKSGVAQKEAWES